jgi:hypothetical protein
MSKTKYLKLSWAGGLKVLKSKYSSMELAKKAIDWRKSLKIVTTKPV